MNTGSSGDGLQHSGQQWAQAGIHAGSERLKPNPAGGPFNSELRS